MHKEIRDSVILFVGTGVTALLGLVFSAYVQNSLGGLRAADFVTAMAIVAWCQIALGPINTTIARFTAKYAAKNELGCARTLHHATTRKLLVFSVFPIVLGGILVKPAAGFLQLDDWITLVITIPIVALTLLLIVSRGTLRGLQRYDQLNINTVVESAIRLLLGIGLLALMVSVSSALLAYLLAVLAGILLASYQSHRLLGDHEPGDIDRTAVSAFIGPMLVVMMVSAAFQNLDMLAARHYLDDKSAGEYGAAFTLGRLVAAIVTPFTILMLPMLTAVHEQGGRFLTSFLRVLGMFVGVVMVPLVVLLIWPDRVMSLVFDSDFEAAAPLLFPIALVRCLGFLCHMIALAGAASGDFRFLWLYVPGVVVQCAWLVMSHDSAASIANSMLYGHVVALGLMFVAGIGLFGRAAGRDAQH